MIAVVVVVACLAVVVAICATWAWCGRRDGTVFPGRIHAAVIVTLKTGDGYRGVLFEVDRHALVLRNAESLNPDGTRIVVDGELIALRADVAYLQRP